MSIKPTAQDIRTEIATWNAKGTDIGLHDAYRLAMRRKAIKAARNIRNLDDAQELLIEIVENCVFVGKQG